MEYLSRKEAQMEFIIERQEKAMFYAEPSAYPGVAKIASKVRADIQAVTGSLPGSCAEIGELGRFAVVYGTLGKSPALDDLASRNLIDLRVLEGKRESYAFQLVDKPYPNVQCALVIAGSDKRGTVYGLFRLSDAMGVSPLINWSDCKPEPRQRVVLTEKDSMVSKEPSVRFRGFFINDEWPALGTWATKRFGGLNAKMYDCVFELLLRLKGNYLWPAMWASVFSDDGPGLANAELADEYGVVMGMSHHEPCLRHGEEYKRLRGKDSKYGDAWNFRTNREGITKFWEDGLARSGAFENVITVGMRGEADSAILGKKATMADNVELLRDVLKTQNRLIDAKVKPLRGDAPKMLALYKEVEAYFYGDAQTPGLIGSEELEDVILMFSDDNFGNLRTLPTPGMRGHKGGYGIYYHFDYHGWPVSYEWVNSTYLPKVWEQMTTAWEFGVRDLWIVNVGDICTNEFPLSYFLDLAYDFEKWGTAAVGTTRRYTREWVDAQFGSRLDARLRGDIAWAIEEYTRIAHMRRPEAMGPEVYHPFNHREADRMLERVGEVMGKVEALKAAMPAEAMPVFWQQVYFPAMGNMNVQKLQLLAGKNMAYARNGRVEANAIPAEMEKCLEFDVRLEKDFHAVAGGKWQGLGLSEHIGFRHWNEEECSYPLQVAFKPANKPRIVVSVPGSQEHSQGGPWTGKTLHLRDFERPDAEGAAFDISCGSAVPAAYELKASPWLRLSSAKGTVAATERISVRIDRSLQAQATEGEILVLCGDHAVRIVVPCPARPEVGGRMVFLESGGCVAMEAEHYYAKADTPQGSFIALPGHGRTLSAMKARPFASSFRPGEDAPSLEYRFIADAQGPYTATLYMSPSNPVDSGNKIIYAIQANGDPVAEHNVIPEGAKVGDDQEFWARGALGNVRIHSSRINCAKGLNSLRIFAVTPGFVLERIVLNPEDKPVPPSYLGPEESFFTA
jgi:hypothetical protein